MRYLFLNGPVQNGPFTFASQPGKAVGIRLADALNAIIGVPSAPHLWNTVTLAGDLRHRETRERQISRKAFEAELIAGKYPSQRLPAAGIMTDADAEVATLALEMIEKNLRAGTLIISQETAPTCQTCGHMSGSGSHRCNACGSADIQDCRRPHLVASLAKDRSVLDRSDIHANHHQQPRHLQNTASNVPQRLILSRTRDHGVDLSPFGLNDLVLDPRAGIHVTVLAAARRLQADKAVMTITQNAANHIAAHGQHFREHLGVRLQYALHGHLPYDQTTALNAAYARCGATATMREMFETWFLPLYSLRSKNRTDPRQLPPLFKHFRRAAMAMLATPDMRTIQAVRQAVFDGNTDWITSKPRLAAVMAAQFGSLT
ncbi:hypothetical protein [Sphaerimonospora thailandensis]|uniref:Uncharacterized protein n=1 Tax=Sphaerimonospora thailandensis TaxID=795644 RepID=A0A8J3W2S1_9ACTN|nr:hypothetical protein [Sphaerimonospora thailandensis]GIH73096.1 hypothetical protein Mth01_53490 [Sphaerimonospora thailandensis]